MAEVQAALISQLEYTQKTDPISKKFAFIHTQKQEITPKCQPLCICDMIKQNQS